MMNRLFESLLEFANAQNQAAWGLFGFIFCALGALVLIGALEQLVRTTRVQGRMIGVRVRNGFFYSVYRYSLPSGQVAEATADSGSGELGDRRDGRLVEFRVDPHEPTRAQVLAGPIWIAIGALVCALGVGMLRTAMSFGPAGPLTYIFVAVFVGMMGSKLVSALRPGRREPGKRSWQAIRSRLRNAGMEPIETFPVQTFDVLPIETLEKEAKRRQLMRRWAPVIVLAGIVLVGLSARSVLKVTYLEWAGIRVPGVVESLAGRGSVTFAQARFTAVSGESNLIKDSIGSSPALYRVGEPVHVLYLPEDPARALIDRGAFNWLPGAALLLAGAGLVRWGLSCRKLPGLPMIR